MSTGGLYPLASLSQVERTPSGEDGIPADLEEDLRAYGCKLIHQAGILLKQKQVAVATAQILFQRFYYVSSMKSFGIGDIGMGALFLASKLEECALRMRDVINVFDLLFQRAAHNAAHATSEQPPTFKYAPMSYFGNTFYDMKDALVVSEMQILKRLGFHVYAVLPYGTLVNYMRLLGLTSREEVVNRAWGYLNDALQTPVYALYSVPTIVSAAILLTVRHFSIPLPSTPPNCWWELFDAEWEDVWSVCGYIMRLYRKRTPEEERRVLGMVGKKDVRKWLDEQGSSTQMAAMNISSATPVLQS
ncbi:cyclin-like protein [Dentipellis sp. KUC8613]|nr:cyclin-like protein [Dentipellis sp. KUC8613]